MGFNAPRASRTCAAGCIDPGTRARLLLPYVLSKCSDDGAVTFETHLLKCDTCFRDLKILDRAGTLLQELLAPETPGGRRLHSRAGGDSAAIRSTTASGAAQSQGRRAKRAQRIVGDEAEGLSN